MVCKERYYPKNRGGGWEPIGGYDCPNPVFANGKCEEHATNEDLEREKLLVDVRKVKEARLQELRDWVKSTS